MRIRGLNWGIGPVPADHTKMHDPFKRRILPALCACSFAYFQFGPASRLTGLYLWFKHFDTFSLGGEIYIIYHVTTLVVICRCKHWPFATLCEVATIGQLITMRSGVCLGRSTLAASSGIQITTLG